MYDESRPDASLMELGRVLASHPEVVTARERELLTAIARRFRAEHHDAAAYAALDRAVAAALGIRATEALGGIIAREVLGAAGARDDVAPPPVFAPQAPPPEPERREVPPEVHATVAFTGVSSKVWERARPALERHLGLRAAADAGEGAGAGGVVYRWEYARNEAALTIACTAKPMLLPYAAVERRIANALDEARAGG